MIPLKHLPVFRKRSRFATCSSVEFVQTHLEDLNLNRSDNEWVLKTLQICVLFFYLNFYLNTFHSNNY